VVSSTGLNNPTFQDRSRKAFELSIDGTVGVPARGIEGAGVLSNSAEALPLGTNVSEGIGEGVVVVGLLVRRAEVLIVGMREGACDGEVV
jgi:hypothetical protein